MYRIDTEKLANFKDATTGLREGLEEARDDHVLQMGGLQECWEGEGANSALAAGQELIGQMEDEIASLKGLEEVLGNALENARRLRVQSKKFVEILEGDESGLHYTGHGYAIGAPIGDGVISVEESTVTKVVESCNHAAETAREIEDITYEIDALLGSLEYVHIDISDQTAKIRKDCTKVERLEEYGRSYKRYAEEFIELDRYLCKALEPYQSEENKGLAEMDLRRYNYYINSPGKREKPVEDEALPVIAGGVTAALLGVEPFVDVTITPSEDYEQDVEESNGISEEDINNSANEYGKYTEDDYKWLLGFYGENTNCEGYIAVAYVVLNRAERDDMTIQEVAESKQFTGYRWNYDIDEVPDDIKEAAKKVLNGTVENPIGDAYFFFGRKDEYDLWIEADECTYVKEVGGNVFYNYEDYGKVHNMQTEKTEDALVIYDATAEKWKYRGLIIDREDSE